jgi:hypothetical protein
MLSEALVLAGIGSLLGAGLAWLGIHELGHEEVEARVELGVEVVHTALDVVHARTERLEHERVDRHPDHDGDRGKSDGEIELSVGD